MALLISLVRRLLLPICDAGGPRRGGALTRQFLSSHEIFDSQGAVNPRDFEKDPSTALVEVPRRFIGGRYLLDDEIGRGGMCVVYRAIDCVTEASVAVKLLNPFLARETAATRTLEAEARFGLILQHPNLVDIVALGYEHSRPFLVMELLKGQNLDVTLRRAANFVGGDEARACLTDLLAALSHIHAAGVAHGDVKPANLFICSNGGAKLIDFGLARMFGEPALYEADAVSPVFASPERLAGAPPEPRDDLYALGCLTYLLLTGRHPFDRIVSTEARRQGLCPPTIQGLTSETQRAVSDCLSFDPAQRPPHAGILLQALL